MKPSIFNCIWEVGDESILFNCRSGCLEVAHGDLRDWVKRIIENKRVFDDEFLQLHLSALIHRLYVSGFLVDKERDELKEMEAEYLKAKYKANPEQWEIAIAPTMSCNYDCTYCYASVKSGSHMLNSTQEQLIARMREFINANTLKTINISWIGGEPLLRHDIIRAISDAIYRECDKGDIGFTSSIITNASLLTDEIAEELAYPPFNVRYIQITIDVFWHEESRPFKNRSKGSSLEATIGGLKSAIKHLPGRIWVRINVPFDPDLKPGEIGKYVIELKEKLGITDEVNFYFAPVQPSTENARLGVAKQWPAADYASFIREVETYLMEGNSGYRANALLRRGVTCGYDHRENICIDSNGYIYKCWHHIGVYEKAIGHIEYPFNNDFYSGESYQAWQNWNPFETKCKICKCLPLCLGFCSDYASEMGVNDEGRCTKTRFTLREDCADLAEGVLRERVAAANHSTECFKCNNPLKQT